MAVYVNTYGTSKVNFTDSEISKMITKEVDLTPAGIIDRLKLKAPIYQKTAAYGHFGRTPDEDGGFSWERTDLANVLKGSV